MNMIPHPLFFCFLTSKNNLDLHRLPSIHVYFLLSYKELEYSAPHNPNITFFLLWLMIWSVFNSMVAGAFQITFRAKMHANDFFLFFKNYFWHQHIKTTQNIQTILNFSKKKISKYLGTQPQPRSQT
jgi:hypothetical protein